jgi:1-acyl-sn-glycerol-3-phosphate acyltransferase
LIRFLWASLVLASSTLFFGTIVILAAIFRVRGDFYTRATQRWARVPLRASRTPLRVIGAENVRPDEPQIIVANHLSAYDILALAAVLPPPFHFVAKKELERVPFFGRAWKAAGHISIDRSNRQSAIASLKQAAEKIRRERAIVIVFAEGTRSRTGELLPFKKGAFTLALEAGAPVVPTAISGSDRILRSGSWKVHPATITIQFGEPIPVGPERGIGAETLMEETHRRVAHMLAHAARAPKPDLPG